MAPSCSVCSGTPKTLWRSIPACADCSRDSLPPRRHDALRGRGPGRETQRRQVHALERPGGRAPRDRLPQTAVHPPAGGRSAHAGRRDRKSTRLNSSHTVISYAVFCLKKKKKTKNNKVRKENKHTPTHPKK